MSEQTVRKQKAGDQLSVGDWLAPGALMERAAEVLFVYPFSPDADAIASGLAVTKTSGPYVQLVVREQGRTGVWPDLVSGAALFNLASDEDLAGYREAAERAQKIANIRALADFLESNPGVPAPDSVHAQASPGRNGDVWNSGTEGIAQVRRVAEIFGEKVRQDDERTEVVKRFGGFDYTYIAWHKDGRPAEPEPEPVRCHAQTTEAFTGAAVPCALNAEHAEAHRWEYEGRTGQFPDPTGLAYSRADDEQDDPTPVSPARVPLHTGGMTDRGLVDETAAAVIPVADGHVVHECCGTLDDAQHENFCAHYDAETELKCTPECDALYTNITKTGRDRGFHDDGCPWAKVLDDEEKAAREHYDCPPDGCPVGFCVGADDCRREDAD